MFAPLCLINVTLYWVKPKNTFVEPQSLQQSLWLIRDGNLRKTQQLRVNINLEQVVYKNILELIDSLEKQNVSVCLQEMSRRLI